MFSPDIVCSEEFSEMPPSSRELYFQLGMRADDDGFIQPKGVIRTLGAKEDDLRMLIARRFVLPFESGVIVIKHWLIHNMIRGDRYKPTRFTEEKSTLYLKENKAYTDDSSKGTPVLATKWQPVGNQMAPQVRLGKVSIGKRDTFLSSKKYLLEIPEEDILEFREKFEASASQIKRKAEQMHNYCESKGKVYKNYRAFLENGLDKDFGRRAKVAVVKREPEKVYTPEETARIEEKKREISTLFKVKST